MQTWILVYFWSLPRGVSPRLEWGHARVLSSRTVAAVSRFPSRGSRDLCLSLEAFPRGFPTGLSHVPPWCESILGLKVEALQGNQFSLHCLDFQAEDRLKPRWHVGQPCRKASWESLVGKPRGKASWESLEGKPRGKATDPLIHAKGRVTVLLQLGRKVHVHAPTRDED